MTGVVLPNKVAGSYQDEGFAGNSAVFLVSSGAIIAPPPTLCKNSCPLTQGFWKNHGSGWPATSLTLGSQTYTEAELLTILGTPVRGDASLILAYQLIAAKLNIANGACGSSITATIAAADTALSAFTGKLPYNVAPSSTAGQTMTSLAANLDTFNSSTRSGCVATF